MSNFQQPTVDSWIAEKIIKLSESLSTLTALGQAANLRDEAIDKRLGVIEKLLQKHSDDQDEQNRKIEEEKRATKSSIRIEITKIAASAFFGGVVALLSGQIGEFFTHHK